MKNKYNTRARRGEEVGSGFGAAEGPSRGVVGSGRGFDRIKRAQPYPSFLPRISNLGCEYAPRALPDAAELGLCGSDLQGGIFDLVSKRRRGCSASSNLAHVHRFGFKKGFYGAGGCDTQEI
uniref:Uncharacterized protein n=1 Tax=Kalanchoe fedtschenkoi TaxID=63787 RepID=A0A7N0UN50_KALFE